MAKEKQEKLYKVDTNADGTYTIKIQAQRPDGTMKYASFKGEKEIVEVKDADGNVIDYKKETKQQMEKRIVVHLIQNAEADGYKVLAPSKWH